MKFQILEDYPREKWYRMPDREKQKFPCPTFREGDWVRADRLIVRTGYYYQPEDMPADLLRERLIAVVRMNANCYLSMKKNHTLKSVLAIPEYSHTFEDVDLRYADRYLEPVTQEQAEAMLHVMGKGAGKSLEYKIRGAWMREMRQQLPLETKHLRTFWYVDKPGFSIQADGRRTRKVGVWYPGYNGGWSSDDYDPPYLDEWNTQVLLRVGNISNLFVHPADVIRGEV